MNDEFDSNPTVAACDVCVVLDDDHRLKPDVVWCRRCEAYICTTCRANGIRRFLALWKRRLQRRAA